MSAPPFLPIPPHRHHRGVLRQEATGDPMPSDEEVEATIAAIVEGRVGGHFWQPLPPDIRTWLGDRDDPLVAVTCTDPARLPRLMEAADGGDPILLVGPYRSNATAIRFDGQADPWPLLNRVTRVYCDDPGETFATLAALAGTPLIQVEADGSPLPVVGHAQRVIAKLCRDYRAYSPYEGSAWPLGHLLAYLALWRTTVERTRGIDALFGISRWKRRRIREFLLGSPDAAFRSRLTEGEAGAVAAWPSRADLPVLEAAFGRDRVSRIEDGFIRSAGLGAALVQPCSIVLDRRGIYYDPDRPSDLEHLLRHTDFDDRLLDRAADLIATIRARGTTKYNLRGLPVRLREGEPKILIAGQVADDLSIAAGGGAMDFAAIAATVRAQNPGATIVYKPHPDVVAGLRRGEWRQPGIAANVDLIVTDGDTNDLLEQVDIVHVRSSLLGFEALLRGKQVFVHGRPFYAGWGLTRDSLAFEQRRRRLTLEQLVAATLILYPLYVDPARGLPCSPEHLLAALADAQPRSALRNLLARLVAMPRNWNNSH
jgi:capsular polysaccharide export protein